VHLYWLGQVYERMIKRYIDFRKNSYKYVLFILLFILPVSTPKTGFSFLTLLLLEIPIFCTHLYLWTEQYDEALWSLGVEGSVFKRIEIPRFWRYFLYNYRPKRKMAAAYAYTEIAGSSFVLAALVGLLLYVPYWVFDFSDIYLSRLNTYFAVLCFCMLLFSPFRRWCLDLACRQHIYRKRGIRVYPRTFYTLGFAKQGEETKRNQKRTNLGIPKDIRNTFKESKWQIALKKELNRYLCRKVKGQYWITQKDAEHIEHTVQQKYPKAICRQTTISKGKILFEVCVQENEKQLFSAHMSEGK